MLARRLLEVFVLVVCIAKSICTDGELKVSSSKELNQADAEIILSAQTTLRRYFIESLANLEDNILGSNPFYSVVNGILQGLRSRDLDPFKSFRNGYKLENNQSAVYQMATVIYSMQGCSSAQITLSEWQSFLRTIPHIDDIVPPQPINIRLTPHHLHKVNAANFPHAVLVLLKIHQNELRPTKRLLGDVLYNYRFRNHTPDLDVALNNIVRMLGTSQAPLHAFRPNPASVERPDEILFDIFKFLFRRQHFHAGLAFETAQLLSALSKSENVEHLRGASTPWKLLELIRNDDYPPDVVRAAIRLATAIRNKQVKVVAESYRGYSPLEKLLSLISQLAAIPSGDPLSGVVHAIYPHVKLRYLSSKERFFHPHTSSDVAFLLNSFLTVPSRLLIGEVHKIFLLPDFNWRTVLKEFDYSKYSKPRSLLTDMLEQLLRNSDKLPACDLVLFSYFLRNNSQVLACSPYKFYDDVLSEKLRGPTMPLSVLPDVQEIGPTAAPHETSGPETTVAQCSDGPPVELVDPDSIIEIFSSDHRTAFISDLIRLNPMPAGMYPNETRVAVYRRLMNNLKTDKYNHSLTAFVIQQALMKIPLNEKADFPPRYVHLCPFEVAAMKDNAPTQRPPPAISLPPCEPIPVIDQESIVDITSEDPNFDSIKRLFSPHTILYEQYKNFLTRELVLKAFLSNRKRATRNPVERLEITQIMEKLVISQDGQRQPVVREECPKAPPPTCQKTIDPHDIVDVIDQHHRSQFLLDLITTEPIPFHQYEEHLTRGAVYKALLKDRGKQLPYGKMSQLMQTPLNGRANLPLTYVETCREEPLASTNAKIQCKSSSAVKDVIDPRSLVEIVEGTDVRYVQRQLSNVPLLADEYLSLGDRRNILLHFLIHYDETGFDQRLPGLRINEKGQLPPVVKQECVALSVPAFPQANSTSKPAEKCLPRETSTNAVRECMSNAAAEFTQEQPKTDSATSAHAVATTSHVTVTPSRSVAASTKGSLLLVSAATTVLRSSTSATPFSPFSFSVATSVPQSLRSVTSSSLSPPQMPPSSLRPTTVRSPVSAKSTAPSQPFSPTSAAVATLPVTTMLPPITTTSLTIVSVSATSTASHASTTNSWSSSFPSDTIDNMSSFFSSQSSVSPTAPTALPPHLLQNISTFPPLPPTSPSASSPYPPSPPSTVQPPFTGNSNPLQQLPPTATATFSQRRLPLLSAAPQQFSSAFPDNRESTSRPPLSLDPSQSSPSLDSTPSEAMQRSTAKQAALTPTSTSLHESTVLPSGELQAREEQGT